MIAPAGIVATFMVLLTPLAVLSGMDNVSGPELNVAVAGGAVVVMDSCCMVPLQIVAEAGVTVATNGPTVSVATLERNIGVHEPPIATWNWCPLEVDKRFVSVNVAVVAPV